MNLAWTAILNSLVLDDVSCHKSKTIREYAASAGDGIVLEFLPPYTPQLNPTEIQWRVLKGMPAGRYFESIGGPCQSNTPMLKHPVTVKRWFRLTSDPLLDYARTALKISLGTGLHKIPMWDWPDRPARAPTAAPSSFVSSFWHICLRCGTRTVPWQSASSR